MEKGGRGIPGRRASICRERCLRPREARSGKPFGEQLYLSLHPAIAPSPSGWVLVPLAKWASPPQVLELQQTLAQKDQALGKLEQSLRLMEEASYDGTFLWKITNVSRRCQESACGRTVSLFSPGNSPGSGEGCSPLRGRQAPRGPGDKRYGAVRSDSRAASS